MTKLDHDQDQTDVLAKAVKPDHDFMEENKLCPRCNGPKRKCEREDCPQREEHNK